MDRTTFITQAVFHLLSTTLPRWIETGMGPPDDSELTERVIAMAEGLWDKYEKTLRHGGPAIAPASVMFQNGPKTIR